MELPTAMTLNILGHELERFGAVRMHTGERSLQLRGVRIWAGALARGAGELSHDVIYVCAHEGAHDAPPQECPSLYVRRATDTRPAQGWVELTCDLGLVDVCNAVQGIFAAYGEWCRQMDAALIEGCTAQDLVDCSERFLRNHVVVVDPALKLVACTWDTPCDDPVTCELMAHGYHTDDNIKKFKLNKRFAPWSTTDGFIVNDSYKICKYVTAVYSFKAEAGFSLIAVMMCNNAAFKPWLRDTFGLFLRRLACLSRREYPQMMPSGNRVDSFVRDLLSGALTDSGAITERARFAGIPDDGKFCLFSIALGKADEGLAARVISETAQKVAPAKVISFEGAIVVLCFNCRTRRAMCPRGCRVCSLECSLASTDEVRVASTIVSRLEKLMGRYGLICGRSSSFSTLSQARCAYLQARTATEISMRLRRGGESTGICAFDDVLGVFLLSHADVEGEQIVLRTSACQLLARMRTHDRERGSDDYEVLRTYLREERRTVQVAQELGMHRNSVRSRVQHILDEYGIDEEDSRTRSDLLLGFLLIDSLPERDDAAHGPAKI